MEMRKWLCFVAVLALAVTDVSAEQYWIAYEGNDFPENEGWTRRTFGGGAERWIEDGTFVIDSRASLEITDSYRMEFSEGLDPGPGETFRMEWRLKIDELIGRVDPTIGVFSDDKWAVALQFSDDSVVSLFEDDIFAPFEPAQFHDFVFRSTDMRHYELYIDGVRAIQGTFWLSLDASRVYWGDTTQGGASLTEWDHFRWGVVPEPTTFFLFVTFILRKTWR